MSGLQSSKSQVTHMGDDKLRADLEKYRQMALNMGAEDAKIVPRSDLVQTLKTRMAAVFPKDANTSSCYLGLPIFLHYPWRDTKAILDSYRYVIMAKIPFFPEERSWFAGPTSGDSLPDFLSNFKRFLPPQDFEYWRDIRERQLLPKKRKINPKDVSSRIEAEARKDGHQFAFSGNSGVCISLCEKFGGTCVMLRTGLCRNPGQSRPNGTSAIVGVDLPATYAKLGWQNWVQAWSVFPEDYPSGTLRPTPHNTITIFID